jgi:helix-turn-helix protein
MHSSFHLGGGIVYVDRYEYKERGKIGKKNKPGFVFISGKGETRISFSNCKLNVFLM